LLRAKCGFEPWQNDLQMQTEIMGKITDLDWDFWCILKAATGHQEKNMFPSTVRFFFSIYALAI
jgi:hypothetical protein